MKLPGTIEFGVQTLGRPDKGAMRAKADAEQRAALAWGDALSTIGKEVSKVAIAEANADASLTLSERVAMDKKSTGELDTFLASTMTVKLADDNVPEAVRQAAEKFGAESGVVDTYLIAEEAAKIHFEKTRKDSYSAISEQHQSDKATTSYNQQMDNVWTGSAKSAKKTHIIQRIQHLSARADVMYNEALNQLDEEAMLNVVIDAEQNGIWTPEYAAIKFNSIGSTVDQVNATRQYSEASTQGELDAADDFVKTSRIAPDARMKMYKMSKQQQEFMYAQEMRKQPVNYANAQAKLIEGTLTPSMIVDMIKKQEISGAHANTLRNALDTPSPVTSDAAVLDRFTGEIAMLRFGDPNVDPDSVKARADRLRKDFQVAFTGTTSDSASVSRDLTGEDFAKLMQALDDEVNTALGAGGRVDSIAMTQIRQLTGYTNAIAEKLGGAHPRARAKADFERALLDYKNANPTGDALEFVARNAHLFTAESYKKDYAETLASQFQRYSDTDKNMSKREKGITIEDVVVGGANAGILLHRARTDMLKGSLTADEYERLRRGLEYTQYKRKGPRSSDEEPVE